MKKIHEVTKMPDIKLRLIFFNSSLMKRGKYMEASDKERQAFVNTQTELKEYIQKLDPVFISKYDQQNVIKLTTNKDTTQ